MEQILEILGSPTGRLVLAVVGIVVIVRVAMRMFSRPQPSGVHVRVRCTGCGWKGTVGKYNRRCSACGGTELEDA